MTVFLINLIGTSILSSFIPIDWNSMMNWNNDYDDNDVDMCDIVVVVDDDDDDNHHREINFYNYNDKNL